MLQLIPPSLHGDSLLSELSTACETVLRAGHAVMTHYGDQSYAMKMGGSPVSAADRASNGVITSALMRAYPDDGILSEESADSSERMRAHRVWIVDPLDGTREFIAGVPEFAVMIALWQKDMVELAVIHLPAADTLYFALRGRGAYRASASRVDRLRCVRIGKAIRVVCSRSHPHPAVIRVCERLGYSDIERCGSVGVKCARIAEGERDLYFHPVGGMGEWDTAAPELMICEAGGEVVDCMGQALTYNKSIPLQPRGIIVGNKAVVGEVLDALRRVAADDEKTIVL